ncbi:MAG: glycosyltransferase family 2 protein [Acetobacteraceae bacterium]
MEITVCVCTHNRPRYLRDCLAGLRRQTIAADRFGILVVDSASDAASEHQAEQLARTYGARLIRLNQPGISAARNAGAWDAGTEYVAYVDDDAIPAPDWVESIFAALEEPGGRPALLGGRILPLWEAPLPDWWPPSLLGILSIIEHEGRGTYRTPELPAGLEPYAANMVVHVPSLRAMGGFGAGIGRFGQVLLSDEDVQLAWSMQNAGHPIRYDSRIVVYHQIQPERLRPDWLLSRLYWQGASTVLTRRVTNQHRLVWREFPRRCLVAALFAPLWFVPAGSVHLLPARWRLAYSLGTVRAALGWPAGREAVRRASDAVHGVSSGPGHVGGSA